MRILLIEDHKRLAELVVRGLAEAGFRTDAFATADDGLAAAKTVGYDAIVLDLGLPDRDGFEVLRELRGGADKRPILILTARDQVDDRVAGLDGGADDYMLKPFAMKELAARLRALLRRPDAILGKLLSVGNIVLDTVSRQVKVDGRALAVPPRELETLELLMRRAGQVVSRRAIEDRVYGFSDDVQPNAVEAVISRLRKRLTGQNSSAEIHTMRGVGYLLTE
ncbi:MAG TPA: response regulator transcription factor [Alphaproteobacteria bacterium]|jgi:DNA-binding response OmpR family regulator|nr:response regulator transcription factor [Alphaproteobacteria bacterium]